MYYYSQLLMLTPIGAFEKYVSSSIWYKISCLENMVLEVLPSGKIAMGMAHSVRCDLPIEHSMIFDSNRLTYQMISYVYTW